MCLQLALGTRVCAVRVDSPDNLTKVVSPLRLCVCVEGVAWGLLG